MRRTLAVALVLASALHAQTTRVVPAAAATSDRNDVVWYPYTYEFGRAQQLWHGDVVCQNAAVIQSFAMRRDAIFPRAFNARTLPALVVTLGYSSQTATTMSATFAANRTGTQTTIHNGPFNLPPQPTVTGIGPWNLVIVASQPFVYQRSLGNLLAEWELPGIANVKYEYGLDAEVARATGATRVLGTWGRFLGGDQPTFNLASPTSQLQPGGSLTLRASGLLRGYPSLLWFGSSVQAWGAVPLPLDLGLLGAPGNVLHTGLEAVTTLSLQLQGTTYAGSLVLPLANDPTLGGQTVYAQMLCVDPSNALGLVFANAVELQLAGGPVFTQTLGADDSNAATGLFTFAGTGGAVVQFTGSFQ